MVMALSWWRGRRSYYSPGLLLACLRMRSVGSLRGVDSSASCGQWLNRVSRRWRWAWAPNLLSGSLFITRVRCSIPVCVALSRMGVKPKPASFRGLCTPSMGKLGRSRSTRACLIAVLRMPSMFVSCLSLNTPRYMAWYVYFNDCSIAIDLRGGLSLRFARALDNYLTSLVLWRKCSWKSSMGLMWTPSILYDLFGGRYLIWVPSANMIEMICSCNMV